MVSEVYYVVRYRWDERGIGHGDVSTKFQHMAAGSICCYTAMAADICDRKSDSRYPWIVIYMYSPQDGYPSPAPPSPSRAICSLHLPSKDVGTTFLRPTLRSPSNYTELSSYRPLHSISPAQRTKPSPSVSHNSANDINFNRHPGNPPGGKFGTAS